jgi:hypothetical protein
MDFLEDRRGGREGQASPAELLRDQRPQIAGLRQRLYEAGRVLPVSIDLPPIFTREASTKLGDFRADFGMRIGGLGDMVDGFAAEAAATASAAAKAPSASAV